MYILRCMRHGCYGCRKADFPALPSVYSYLCNWRHLYDGCTKTENYATCGKSVILSVGGSTLVVTNSTQKEYIIKRNDIHCYLFIFHIESWDQE